MKVNVRKLTMTVMLSSVAVALSTAAVADVRVRLVGGNNFVVEDRTTGIDNLVVRDAGLGVEVPRGPLELKDGDATGSSAGKLSLFESSTYGTNKVTFKSVDDLASSWILTLPDTDGNAGQILTTDGTGILSWGDAAGVSTDSGCETSEDVVDLVATSGGRTWMDRNLGASNKSTSSTDSGSYGGLFQWGRGRDGHECSWRSTYTGSVGNSDISAGNAWDGLFILENNVTNDWLITQDNTLWGDGTAGGTTKGPNDPCPAGYQVPNENELVALSISNSADAFITLALSVGGSRNNDGELIDGGIDGDYWSSTVSGTNARYLRLNSGAADMLSSGRAYGMSLRCIQTL